MPGTELKIAYLCDWSPLDRNLYSGGNARIYDALRAHAGEVTILSNAWHLAEPMRRLMHSLPDAVNLRARWRLHLALAPVIAAGVRRDLARGCFDVLFGAYSYQSLYRLRPPYPLVTAYTSDATPTGYKRSEIGQSFGSYLSLSRFLDPWVLRTERAVFRSLDLALWPGEWQKRTADALFDLTDTRSVVVPWGANVDDPGPGEVPVLDPAGPVRLLFVGRDWQAKGGPLVIELVRMLRGQGVDARLTVVGCAPSVGAEDWLDIHPSLDKAKPDQLATFQALYRAAHFLVMASFESWGFVYCEAAAYGLPSLCLRTGGIPVRDGVNGHALPPGSRAAEFAAPIRRYLDDPGAYAALRATSRQLYQDELNWDAWGRRTAALLRARVAAKRGA